MKVNLPHGWSIEIPKDFQEERNDGIWEACDDEQARTIFITVYSVAAPLSAKELRELVDGPDMIEHQDGMLFGYASVSCEEDDLIIVRAASYVLGTAAICTIALAGERYLSWALDTWKTLRSETPLVPSLPQS